MRSWRHEIFRGRAAMWIAVGAFAAAALGCGAMENGVGGVRERMAGGGGSEVRERRSPRMAPALILAATAEKSLYRPGEAVVIEVTLQNTTSRPMQVRALRPDGELRGDEGSLQFTFRVGDVEGDGAAGRTVYPVISRFEKEEMAAGEPGMTLGPGEVRRRKFAFVDVTPAPAEYRMDVSYDQFQVPGREGAIESLPVRYEVYGEPQFARRSDGLIEAEEAMRLALAEAPGDPTGAKTILAEDDRGFLTWWVNVDYVDGRGWKLRQGYLVDPYAGEVMQKTKPFEDPREAGSGAGESEGGEAGAASGEPEVAAPETETEAEPGSEIEDEAAVE